MVNFRKLCVVASLSLGIAMGAASVRAADVIKIDGSSTVYPVTEAVAEEFGAQNKGVRVTVGISGTGGGFKKFCRGETDVQDASRPILTQEMADAKTNGVEYIELPIAFDALTVVIHPANTWAETITVEELKKIWEPSAQGKVMKWSDVRAGWPDAPLKLYGAGSDSGTFDYFTEATVGKAKSSRGDYTASEDDNVLVQGVSSDKNALGYFGFAYYIENKDKLKAAKVDPGKGAVGPSPETVINATYNPLSRPIFIYVNKKSLAKPEVKKFVEFYVENAADMAKEVKYIPLPESAYTAAKARLDKQLTGTAFGGKAEVGLHIDELFKRELKQ